MQRLIDEHSTDDLLPEDLLTDEQPRARDPPRTPWWKPDETVTPRDFIFLILIYSLPAFTLLLREC